MSFKCIKPFESTSGITYIKGRVIPLFEYTKLNDLEKKNFQSYGE